MKSSSSGLATITLALATALGVSVAGPHRAYAAPASTQTEDSLAITVLSPTPHTSFTGDKPIEVSAFYQGADDNMITSIELYVDGVNAFTKKLDAPEARGVISFLIDTSQLSSGPHLVVVRAVAADAEIVSAKSSFVYVINQPAAAPEIAQPTQSTTPPDSTTLPQLTFVSPTTDESVSGTVKIALKATEPGGASPYVSVFVDRTFKTLRNYPPYEYDLDTTALTNGYHTIEVYGYDDAQNVGPAVTMRVYVNNPGGRTDVRTDLKDGVPAAPAKPVAPAPVVPQPSRKPKTPTTAVNTSMPIAHRLTSRQPMLMAARLPVTNGIDIGDLGLSSPFVADQPSTKQPAASARRNMPPHAMRVADVNAGAPVDSLSDPFVTTSGVPAGVKSRGPARRPSPLLAEDFSTPYASTLRPIMMAKRLDLLDETGGLHPESDLSDPFIEQTPASMASTHSQTPTTGFKPLPKAGTLNAPVLAKTQIRPSAPSLPEMITRDAHTLPIHLSAPTLMAPMPIDIAGPVAAPKVTMMHTVATPAPTSMTIKAAMPVARGSRMNISAQAPITHHRVSVHVLAPAASPLLRAKGQMKVMFNHTTLRLDRPITPRDGVMFGPLRQIFEYDGGTLTWDRKTGEVHAVSADKDITLKIGDRKAEINKKSSNLEMAPYLDEGRTMVPLSFLPAAMDVNVQFDPNSGHLLVSSKD